MPHRKYQKLLKDNGGPINCYCLLMLGQIVANESCFVLSSGFVIHYNSDMSMVAEIRIWTNCLAHSLA